MNRPTKQAKAQKGEGPGPFQCTTCQRTYTRIDHLGRHVRSHRQERPFNCAICGKAYGRSDLLKRHQIRHEDDQNGTSSDKRQVVNASRVSQACKTCATAKIKCDDKKPCSRCVQKGISCEYTADFHDDARLFPSTSSKQADAHAQETTLPSFPEASPESSVTDTAAMDVELPPPPPNQATPETPMPDSVSTALDMSPAVPSFLPHGHSLTEFLRDVMASTDAPLDAMHVDNGGLHGLLDFAVDGDWDFNDTSLGSFDQLSGSSFADISPAHLGQAPPPAPQFLQQWSSLHHQMPPPYHTHPYRDAEKMPHIAQPPQLTRQSMQGGIATTAMTTEMSAITTTVKTTTIRRHMALGAEAFRRSAFGVWLPAHQDCGDAGLENLSILSPEVGSPDARINLDRHYLRERLNQVTRDEFLAMILGTCRPERVPFIVRTFPTSGLLDDMLDCFFAYHHQQVDSFIHIPSFRPNQQKSELLGALIATGATKTGVKALHQLGFAIQEAVRTVIPQRCEEANANTRQLWLLQAFMCQLQLGFWSGSKRKIELAESHMPILFTILRRTDRFQNPKRQLVTPQPDDTGEALHQKWLEWIEQESFKRLAFHAFICDAQVSMTMLTNPTISYAELSIPFPDSHDLWAAEDAEEWKALYLKMAPSSSQEPRLSLLDFLQQPGDIPECYDVALTSLVILSGIWGLIWQHLQLSSIAHRHGGPPASSRQPNTAVVTALRREDLYQTLLHFRVNIAAGQIPYCTETALVQDVLSMYLHASCGDLQLFAGKGDLDDARRILPSLQEWATTQAARQATWHAGQVLRAAASFPPKLLDGYYAVAVYHAGLTLWAYGVIPQSRGGQAVAQAAAAVVPVAPAALHEVCLDAAETPALQAYFTAGRHVPAVGSCRPGAGLVPLSDPESVMDVVSGTLRGNFPTASSDEEVPPLVENLMQLLRGLGRAAGGVDK